MLPRFPRPSLVRAAASLAMATVLAGCGPGPGATGPAGSPASSGTAACPTAPAVGDDLGGWLPSNQPLDLVPVLINGPGQLVCGHNRILFTIIDGAGNPVGAPDRKASIAFYDVGRDTSKPIATADGTFVWAIKDSRGIYVADAAFPEAGQYGAEITTSVGGGPPTVVRLAFDVQPDTPVIGVGDKAPASKTPTLADVGGDASRVSTDPRPDPAFYETSVDQALAKHEPFALIFATPKFCTSAQCGPTLDSIKPYVGKYPTVTFINVEPYKLKLVHGALQADVDANQQLQPTDVTSEWHLLTEPVVYVVNRDGIVTAQFDLIFSDAELTAALDAVR
jgi:hypothetical protein